MFLLLVAVSVGHGIEPAPNVIEVCLAETETLTVI